MKNKRRSGFLSRGGELICVQIILERLLAEKGTIEDPSRPLGIAGPSRPHLSTIAPLVDVDESFKTVAVAPPEHVAGIGGEVSDDVGESRSSSAHPVILSQ